MGVRNFLRERDLFGVPVNLTFRGRSEFQTQLGGCCSLLLILFAMCYFAFYLKYYIEKPGFTSSYDMDYTAYQTDGKIFSLNTTQQTVAVALLKGGDTSGVSSYFRVQFQVYNTNDISDPVQYVPAVLCNDLYAEEIA